MCDNSTNLNLGNKIFLVKEKVLVKYCKHIAKKLSHIPLSHEQSLYDVDTLNDFPNQRYDPDKIEQTDRRAQRRRIS